MTRHLLFFLSIIFIGCNSKKKENYTYFGGKIINPKQNFILLHDDEKILDTIPLTEENTFLGKFKDLEEGLYYFTHGGEFQFAYLEPNDSLLLRLNTWDFDESLVFSGKNSSRNNLLIDAFLNDEKQRKAFYKFHDLNPKAFKNKTDSILNVKKIRLQNYIETNTETSKSFIEIAKIALNYPIYSEIESYIIGNSIKKEPNKLDNSFFEHRKETSLNKDSLLFYTPYNSFVFESLYSDIYHERIKRNSDAFTLALIDNINKRVKSKKLKNKVLKNGLIRHFLSKSNQDLNDTVFNKYYSTSTNKKDIDHIKKLVNDARAIRKEEILPNFSINTLNKNSEDINTIITNKNTLIYFRNQNYSSNDWVAYKINSLEKKYPQVQFLVIDILGKATKNKKLVTKNQFYITKESSAQKFLTSKFPRAVLVDKNGIIKNSFASLSSYKIEHQIKLLEN